jgi:hypothetical protein
MQCWVSFLNPSYDTKIEREKQNEYWGFMPISAQHTRKIAKVEGVDESLIIN